MYTPRSFELTDPNLIAQIIADNSFGTLVSGGGDGLQASHLPFEFDAERNALRSHMARANPHWREFDSGSEVLAIFQGAHGYISPRWYQAKLAVPTWNYLAVHVYGVPSLVENEEELRDLLESLVAKHENAFDQPWKLDAPEDWQQNLRRALVGFELQITRIEAKAKMSQNRPAEDVEGVIAGLEAQNKHELAAWVRQMNMQP